MRRIAILLALIALDMWLIGGSLRFGGAKMPVTLNGSVSAQSGCCPAGTGDYPHLGCDFNGQCQLLPECGFDDCSACEGCDPADEDYCLDIGWIWDSENCECNPPGCDPVAREECILEECDWDEATCTCSCNQSCNPSPPVLVWFDSETTSYCIGCYEAENCTTQTWYYVSYCQDGTIYDTWAEGYSYCYQGSDWGCEQWCELY